VAGASSSTVEDREHAPSRTSVRAAARGIGCMQRSARTASLVTLPAMWEPTAPEEVHAVVARARAAQAGWAALDVDERVRRVAGIKARVLDRGDTIAATIREEIGKPAVEALLGEVLPSADVVAYWAAGIAEMLEARELEIDPIAYPGKEGTIEREGRGVVAVIMPWNFPVALPLRTIVPALLAGNTVVFKPSEVTPRSGALVADLFEGLLPDGVLTTVQGGGDVGAALCGADVDLVVFTGSVATGRRVAHACAERLVPCSLELGGKDAAIVLADANLERAANGIVWGAMMNAGQNCASIERVYVEKEVAEEFTEKVQAVVKSLRPGVDYGPLATAAQRAIVARHVDEAKAAGARILEGGAEPEAPHVVAEAAEDGTEPAPAPALPRDYPPTVVRVDSDDLALMSDETFGPILPIAVVDSVDEAIARANASRYGLTASLWTKDRKRAQLLVRKLRAGVVTVNNHGFTGALPGAPWSGHRETGWGITGSPLALDMLTRPRLVLIDRSRGASELWWYPYTPALRDVARAMATLRSSSQGIVARLGALVRLVGAMLARARGG
jgi:acyl-CoA reductase-like NAD-dependent aldehyde dehydrogenase